MDKQSLLEPKQSRSQQTLERILSSSTTLVAEQSYDELTIAEIAAHAQVSVGGFYSRFQNKEALFTTLQQRLGQETQSRMTDALAADWSASDLHDLLQFIVSNNAELYEKYRGVLTVVHLRTRVMQSRGEDNTLVKAYNQKLVGQLETLILMKRAEIAHRRPRTAIRTAIACMASMLRDAIVFGDTSLYPKPRDMQTITNRVAQVMYQYLATASS
jgi:AcrR family transcriptional regulator